MNAIVTQAKYLTDYKIEILFQDGHRSTVDFKPFLESEIPQYLKAYLNSELFKNFQIENGNIVWGEDWDFVFPRDQLYDGHIEPVVKRKVSA